MVKKRVLLVSLLVVVLVTVISGVFVYQKGFLRRKGDRDLRKEGPRVTWLRDNKPMLAFEGKVSSIEDRKLQIEEEGTRETIVVREDALAAVKYGDNNPIMVQFNSLEVGDWVQLGEIEEKDGLITAGYVKIRRDE